MIKSKCRGLRPGRGAQQAGLSPQFLLGLEAPGSGRRSPSLSRAGAAFEAVMPSCDEGWEVEIAGFPLESGEMCGSCSDGQKAQKHPSLTRRGLRESLSLIGESLFLL